MGNGGTIKRKYTVKITPKLKKVLKRYWDMLQAVNEGYEIEVAHIEEKMEKETRIKGIEFFRSGEGIIGVGNYGMWTMPLVHGETLE